MEHIVRKHGDFKRDFNHGWGIERNGVFFHGKIIVMKWGIFQPD
jgi:hypothetical protein